MTNWKIKDTKISDEAGLSGKYNPVVLRLLGNRSINSQEEVDNFFRSSYEDLQDPSVITHMEKAIGRIVAAKDKKEKIAIFGDYDADGVTATAIIYETLLMLGYEKLCYYIPDRQIEGYGMNEKAVEYLENEGVQLIITVDCGISNAEEIEKAAKAGIDVIITDHHHIPSRIPNAYAIINPNMDNSGFSFRQLAGVGVAFQLARALHQKIDPGNVEQLKWMLDLVAIGTVADCVPLLGDNRILAKYGFVVLSKTRRAGLKEMFSVGRMEISENRIPSTHQVAFQIAPRINAAGRMDHANAAYNLVIEKDSVKAGIWRLSLKPKIRKDKKSLLKYQEKWKSWRRTRLKIKNSSALKISIGRLEFWDWSPERSWKNIENPRRFSSFRERRMSDRSAAFPN
jgi:single-stranded-DNA-specific exonuclease